MPAISSSTSETTRIPLTTYVSSVDKLIALNVGTQLSIKLDGDNYPTWRLQFLSLLIGYELLGYIDGTMPCPAKQLALPTIITNPAFILLVRQNQLILHAIVSLVTAIVVTHFAKVHNSYLQVVKAIANELSIINHPLDNIDLVIHTLNGLSSDYKEISATLCSRETPISYSELHEKVMDFESILHRDTNIDPLVATTNAALRNRSQPR
ncbi:PREDICTED: uncharacterized protein LOC109330925 [Lupinus angustifolius]|uniref:uncharacterized protein LOC109330925 n=1 Tax=Lupinus angustifolius TaxID=3871 RepID=UPI00092FAA4B|nr:PREDICTED: uncharacterized protein LOC109330925 [Lupinus angustifolius]